MNVWDMLPDLDVALNLGLNAVVSVLCSWIVAAIYFRKRSPAELVADQIRYGLQRGLIPILYSHFFDENTSAIIHPEQERVNSDVPRVDYARLSPGVIYPGSRVDILIRMIDLGYDLDNPKGVIVRDHRNRRVDVIGLGLGFCKCSIYIEEELEQKFTYITVDLTDTGGRRSTQTLPFAVKKGAHNG